MTKCSMSILVMHAACGQHVATAIENQNTGTGQRLNKGIHLAAISITTSSLFFKTVQISKKEYNPHYHYLLYNNELQLVIQIVN